MLAAEASACPSCQAQVGPGLLSCPSCHRLVHGAKLSELALTAETATRESRPAEALAAWREALTLLPPRTRQAAEIDSRIQVLSKLVATAPEEKKRGPMGAIAGLGAVGLFLWKFKFLLVAAVTKGKFLLLGLTKLPTLFSMMVAFGAYWALWGWPFALGFVLCIYVHEMGHVVALRRFGISASAPMFIPGFGAFVRMNHRPANAHEDASVGLAGPIWGLGVSVACVAASYALDSRLLAALGHTSAWINLFNLLPLFSLDGGRGFTALSRDQRLMCAGTLAVGWFVSSDTLLLLIAIVAVVRAFMKDAPKVGDRVIFWTYAGLVAALVAVGAVAVPLSGVAHPSQAMRAASQSELSP
jgi:Zn-dependent protease